MPEEIETVSITTAHNHVVVMKAFITGFDLREIEKAMYKNISLKTNNGGPEVSGFTAESINASEDRAFELVVISIDDKSEDILKNLLALPAVDFVQVKDKVNEITGKKALSPS